MRMQGPLGVGAVWPVRTNAFAYAMPIPNKCGGSTLFCLT